MLIEKVKENRFSSTNQLKYELNLQASRQTINRELVSKGYNSYKAPSKLLLNDYQIGQRLLFARAHQSWNENDWHKVVFTDESCFQCVSKNGRICVRRLAEEILEPDTIQHSETKSRSIMVWGSISIHGVGPLVLVRGSLDAEGYLNIFRHRLRWHFPGLYKGELLFQDDNAPPHTADIVNEWFQKYNTQRIDWPSKSPDLNIIENIWGKIKYEIRGQIFNTIDDLWDEINYQWSSISNELIRQLYRSLPTRMIAVIEAEGGVTHY